MGSEQAGRKFWTIASRLDRKVFSLTQANHAEVSVARQIRNPRCNPAPAGTLLLCHKSGFVIDITNDQTRVAATASLFERRCIDINGAEWKTCEDLASKTSTCL